MAAPLPIPMKAGDCVKTDRRDAVMLAKLVRAEDVIAMRMLGMVLQNLQGFLLPHVGIYPGKKGWTVAC